MSTLILRSESEGTHSVTSFSLEITTYLSDTQEVGTPFNAELTPTPDELSEIEIQDIEEGQRAIAEGKGKEFKNVEEALSWLEEDE